MSYFATLSGVQLDESAIYGVRLVPAHEAYRYMSELADQIAALDGSPVYLCDDGVSGTSHEIVCDAIDVGQAGADISATLIVAILRFCEKVGCTFRVWDAGATEPGWPAETQTFATIAEAVAPLSADKYPNPWEVRFVPSTVLQRTGSG